MSGEKKFILGIVSFSILILVIVIYSATKRNERLSLPLVGKEQLRNMFKNKLKGKKIMIPRINMTTPIIMTSWGQILKLTEIEEGQLINFMETNNNRGPEQVPTY